MHGVRSGAYSYDFFNKQYFVCAYSGFEDWIFLGTPKHLVPFQDDKLLKYTLYYFLFCLCLCLKGAIICILCLGAKIILHFKVQTSYC